MAIERRARLLAEDIFEMPDDGNLYEVIDGELAVIYAPTWEHQRVLLRLARRLGDFVDDRRLGELATAPLGVLLDTHTALQPDLVFVSAERLHAITARGVEGLPDLVGEILSPSTAARDRGVKARRYARAGIPHYWIVDPQIRTIETYRLAEDRYELVAAFGPGETLRTECFPDFELPVDYLWA